jgi:hypothetical protein
LFEIDEVVMMPKDTEELSTALEELKINTNVGPCIICDAWYGFPKEGRPRKERILAPRQPLGSPQHPARPELD